MIAVPKFLALEGLRGVLALVVIIGHFGLNTVAGGYGLSVRYNLAVDVFFVISGFVLAHGYYFRERSFADFVVARFARLYPLHLVALVWMLLVVWRAGGPIDAASVVETAFAVNSIVTPPVRLPINHPMWSTSIDIVVSLLLWPAARRGGGAAVVALLVASWTLLALRPFCFGGDGGACVGPVTSGFVRGVAGFVAGVAAYRLVSAWPELFHRRQALALPLLGLLAASTFFPIDSALVPLASLVAAALAVGLLAARDRPGLLGSRAFVFLGSISYSAYLLHNPLYSTLELLAPADRFKGLVGKTAFLALILGVAAGSHFWLELPLKARLLRAAGRGKRNSEPVAAREREQIVG